MQIKTLLLLSVLVLAMGACKKSSDDPAPSSRNQWDGKYRMEGTMTDHSNSAFGWMNNTYQYTLQTSGAAFVAWVHLFRSPVLKPVSRLNTSPTEPTRHSPLFKWA